MYSLERVAVALGSRGWLPFLSDETYLKILFRRMLGYELDLKDPKTFNEKIQWLKLNDRKPEYTIMVDKYAVKKYVAGMIGEQYLIPTLGVWERYDDIDFKQLPESFVLKCTHDSGGLVIVRNKSSMDFAAARKKLTKCLKRNYYYQGREWPYKNVKPRILAEKYIEEKGKIVPEDYKIYCINGEPEYIAVFHNRFSNTEPLSETVYNINWEPQHISLDRHFAISDEIIPKPDCLDELLWICRKLCRDMDFVRIDFYLSGHSIYFGEITLHTAGGFQRMLPEELDRILGDKLKLSPDTIGGGYFLHSGWSVIPGKPERILAAGLTDYKFYCFNGKPRFLYISKGLENHETARISYVTLEWENAPFCRSDYRRFKRLPSRPVNYDLMLDLAGKLSANIPFLRVDFYEIKEQVFFSELTFYPGSGFSGFSPGQWDRKLGELIRLPFQENV